MELDVDRIVQKVGKQVRAKILMNYQIKLYQLTFETVKDLLKKNSDESNDSIALSKMIEAFENNKLLPNKQMKTNRRYEMINRL